MPELSKKKFLQEKKEKKYQKVPSQCWNFLYFFTFSAGILDASKLKTRLPIDPLGVPATRSTSLDDVPNALKCLGLLMTVFNCHWSPEKS